MSNKTFFIEAIDSLCPNCFFRISDENYDDLIWYEGNPLPKPSKEELEAEMLRLQTRKDPKEYQRLRAPEYPSITDLADALYWNSKGDSSHLEAYYNACEEVKNKYPKPQ